MRTAAGIILIVAAAAFLVWGWQASESASSGISRIFKGGPDNRTLWLVAGGVLAAVAGVSLLAFPRRNVA